VETDITDITAAGVFSLGNRTVNRMGYGAMQLAGPSVFGPPKDRNAALGVLREAVAQGVNHIDTSDYYGPHVTNQLICEALHPYPDDLMIVTKVGTVRGADASWIPALTAADLARAVHDNLRPFAFSWGQHYVLPRGKMTWKTDPCGIALAAVMRPPCDSTIDRQIDSPIPIPSAFVVKKTSKIRFSSSGLMPVPESSTDMRTQSASCFSDRTQTRRSRFELDAVASAAFMSKLSTTCCS
jgi:hypothetical protein